MGVVAGGRCASTTGRSRSSAGASVPRRCWSCPGCGPAGASAGRCTARLARDGQRQAGPCPASPARGGSLRPGPRQAVPWSGRGMASGRRGRGRLPQPAAAAVGSPVAGSGRGRRLRPGPRLPVGERTTCSSATWWRSWRPAVSPSRSGPPLLRIELMGDSSWVWGG